MIVSYLSLSHIDLYVFDNLAFQSWSNQSSTDWLPLYPAMLTRHVESSTTFTIRLEKDDTYHFCFRTYHPNTYVDFKLVTDTTYGVMYTATIQTTTTRTTQNGAATAGGYAAVVSGGLVALAAVHRAWRNKKNRHEAARAQGTQN
jgi:hypothetical protein